MKKSACCEHEEMARTWDEEDSPRGAEGAALSAEVPPAGLCSTCNHDPGCAFRGNPNVPVLFCEEFDDSEDSGGSAGVSPRSLQAVKSREPLLGLCGNCDNRRRCAFPKPEGGIWHCEEYI